MANKEDNMTEESYKRAKEIKFNIAALNNMKIPSGMSKSVYEACENFVKDMVAKLEEEFNSL